MLIRRNPQAGYPGATKRIIGNPILAAALRYAEAGNPIFPCEPGGKSPLGALVPQGYKNATTDITTILRWWHCWPDANLAMPTGKNSFDVLDGDTSEDGRAAIALGRLARLRLLAGMRGQVRTPSGGAHLYFNGSVQRRSKLREWHLDFQANGAYVLVPPSWIETDGWRAPYVWSLPLRSSGDTLDWKAVTSHLQPLPRTCNKTTMVAGTASDGVRAVLALDQGERNEGLFRACCSALRAGHLDLSDITAAGLSIGLSPAEVTKTERSARQQVGVTR